MRKALVLGLLGLFFASNAMAGGGCWGSHSTASSDKQQTVMTDTAKPTGSGG